MRPTRPRDKVAQPQDKHAINDQIVAVEVRVIGVDGEQLGILPTREALRIAEEAGVDLVEVSAEAKPPVCRMLDYGKLKYREQKKAAEARKRSSQNTVKELRIRYNTDEHDLEIKVRNARKFLEEGDRVRFQMLFRGREVANKDLGRNIFEEVANKLTDIGIVEEMTPLLGRRMTMSIAPRAAGQVKAG